MVLMLLASAVLSGCTAIGAFTGGVIGAVLGGPEGAAAGAELGLYVGAAFDISIIEGMSEPGYRECSDGYYGAYGDRHDRPRMIDPSAYAHEP